jgi:hypothetical protein
MVKLARYESIKKTDHINQRETEKLSEITELFSVAFEKSFNTKLIGGADEPYYRPMSDDQDVCFLYFREDFISSALHEISHWCIAGEERRGLEDFGYWYNPAGRSITKQAEFERVEVKPQALEWMFSVGCNHSFSFSADNFSIDCNASSNTEFAKAVLAQIQVWCSSGEMPLRGLHFLNILSKRFDTEPTFIENYHSAKAL